MVRHSAKIAGYIDATRDYGIARDTEPAYRQAVDNVMERLAVFAVLVAYDQPADFLERHADQIVKAVVALTKTERRCA